MMKKTILHGLTNLVDWSRHDINIVGAFSNSFWKRLIFDHQPVDIVVTDLIMPELDGIELSLIQKETTRCPNPCSFSSHDDFQLVKDSFCWWRFGLIYLKPKLNPRIYFQQSRS